MYRTEASEVMQGRGVDGRLWDLKFHDPKVGLSPTGV